MVDGQLHFQLFVLHQAQPGLGIEGQLRRGRSAGFQGLPGPDQVRAIAVEHGLALLAQGKKTFQERTTAQAKLVGTLQHGLAQTIGHIREGILQWRQHRFPYQAQQTRVGSIGRGRGHAVGHQFRAAAEGEKHTGVTLGHDFYCPAWCSLSQWRTEYHVTNEM